MFNQRVAKENAKHFKNQACRARSGSRTMMIEPIQRSSARDSPVNVVETRANRAIELNWSAVHHERHFSERGQVDSTAQCLRLRAV